MMKINSEGLELIKKSEGLVLHSYRDAVGVLTIGYGHTGGVKEGDNISKEKAEELLRLDLAKFEAGVLSLVKVPLNENQFSSLVSFSYNVGLGNLKTSTLLNKLNKKDYKGASEEFPKWCHAGGRTLQGLVKRRELERQLFLKEVKTIPKEIKIYHEVAKGETLSGIASHFKTTVSQLAKWNNIKNINIISVGQKLRVK